MSVENTQWMFLILGMGFDARTSDESDACEHKPNFAVGKLFSRGSSSLTTHTNHADHHTILYSFPFPFTSLH